MELIERLDSIHDRCSAETEAIPDELIQGHALVVGDRAPRGAGASLGLMGGTAHGTVEHVTIDETSIADEIIPLGTSIIDIAIIIVSFRPEHVILRLFGVRFALARIIPGITFASHLHADHFLVKVLNGRVACF
jgi:hypothetical protein